MPLVCCCSCSAPDADEKGPNMCGTIKPSRCWFALELHVRLRLIPPQSDACFFFLWRQWWDYLIWTRAAAVGWPWLGDSLPVFVLGGDHSTVLSTAMCSRKASGLFVVCAFFLLFVSIVVDRQGGWAISRSWPINGNLISCKHRPLSMGLKKNNKYLLTCSVEGVKYTAKKQGKQPLICIEMCWKWISGNISWAAKFLYL